VKCRHLIFWLESQRGVYCHTAKLEPNWRVIINWVPLLVTKIQLNITKVHKNSAFNLVVASYRMSELLQCNKTSREVNEETHLTLVDLEKAYDSLPRCKLWEALRNLKN
jgi:hypothetical protein